MAKKILIPISLILALVLANHKQIDALQTSGRQLVAGQLTFIAGDTGRTIIAAPGSGGTLFITYVNCTITTSAAQAFDIDNGSGTTDILKIAASPAVNSSYTVGPLVLGISMGANTTLSYSPAAAGNAGNCVAEGYVVRTGA